jgi:hypothetical protein
MYMESESLDEQMVYFSNLPKLIVHLEGNKCNFRV